jgi:polar amino acid transport system permease protein
MKLWDWSGFFDYLASPYLFGGAWETLWLTVVSMALGLVLGFALALMRRSTRRWLSAPAASYVWLFRGTPVLVQLIVIYTGLPQFGLKLSVVASAVVGLSLNEAAYLAEIIRSGLAAVPEGQLAAGRALGLREWPIMRLIVMPQALRVILPPLGNSVNGLLKTTSIASVISMEELLRRSQELVQERFEVLEIFAVASLYYLALTTAWSLVQARIERRFGRADLRVATQAGA